MWKPVPPPFVDHKKTVWGHILATSSFIYQIGETPALRLPANEIPHTIITSPDTQDKIRYLKDCLLQCRHLTGLGRVLAGVQVGIPERIFVVFMPEISGKLLTIINPIITEQAIEHCLYPEICLSAAPAIATVIRPTWITITYYDEQGKQQLWKTKADTPTGQLYNRVLQHEIDHLNGIINIDLVQSKDIIYESDPTFYEKAAFQKV